MVKNTEIKNKLNNLFENKTFLACVLLTIIYLISGYWKWLEIGVSVGALVFFITLPVQNAFCIYLYLHSFTLSNIGYESCLLATTVCFTLVMLVKYIIGAKKGNYPVYKKLLIVLSIFVIVSTLISLPNKLYRGAWMYFTYFPLFYFFLAMRKDFNIHQAMNYMMTGVICSALLAISFYNLPGFKYYIFLEERFMAFTNHPNSLYIRALFGLTYYMYRLLHNKMSPVLFLIIYVISSFLILSTLSKMGIALLALFTIISIILYLTKDFKKRIVHVGVFALIIVLISLISLNLIINIFDRFFSDSGFEESAINSITTGRDDIWLDYLKQCVKNPFALLFGNGLLTQEVYIHAQAQARAPHSLYIFLLYRFGIVGIVAIGYIIYLMLKILCKEKPKFIAYLPLIMFLLVSLSANTFKSYNFTYIILSAQILFSASNDKQNIIENKTEDNKQVEIENKET